MNGIGTLTDQRACDMYSLCRKKCIPSVQKSIVFLFLTVQDSILIFARLQSIDIRSKSCNRRGRLDDCNLGTQLINNEIYLHWSFTLYCIGGKKTCRYKQNYSKETILLLRNNRNPPPHQTNRNSIYIIVSNYLRYYTRY